MNVTFNGSVITASPENQEEQDVFDWLNTRIDSTPLIRFHLESLLKQRIAQMNDELKEVLLAQVKSGEIVNPVTGVKLVPPVLKVG